MPIRNIALNVAGVVLEDTSDTPLVLLKDEHGEKLMPVPVGAFEASAIIIEVEGIKPPRPLTHDLVAHLFLRHGYKLLRFELYAKTEEGFLGRLRYRKGFRLYSMEVRPSDGIAMALRLEAPIEASEDLFETASSPAPQAYSNYTFAQSVLFLDPSPLR